MDCGSAHLYSIADMCCQSSHMVINQQLLHIINLSTHHLYSCIVNLSTPSVVQLQCHLQHPIANFDNPISRTTSLPTHPIIVNFNTPSLV
mmetsp:Transcript_3287/g.5618  ORF Transcript_3287/g.5618 Transcript_3287/m.5618 type:complete len:90 (-) Transcript_3287:92-361(-)